MYRVLFVLCFLSCSQTQDVKILDKEGFSITYPFYLNLVENKEGAVFVLKTQQEDENDVFIESINLTIQDASENEFNDFAIRTEQEINSFAEIVENKRLIINDTDCLRLIFKLSQNGVRLTFIQHLYLKNQKIYALTFSCETKEFESYFEDMNKTLMSFKIK